MGSQVCALTLTRHLKQTRPVETHRVRYSLSKKSENTMSLRTSPLIWCGNPQNRRKTPRFLTENVLKNRGIPTPLRPQARFERNRRRRLLARDVEHWLGMTCLVVRCKTERNMGKLSFSLLFPRQHGMIRTNRLQFIGLLLRRCHSEPVRHISR